MSKLPKKFNDSSGDALYWGRSWGLQEHMKRSCNIGVSHRVLARQILMWILYERVPDALI